MIRQGVAAVVVAIGLLSACSSDGGGSSSAGTNAPVASDSPAVPTTTSGGDAAGAPDCSAVRDAYGGFLVNSQILVQLPNNTDIATWPTDIGTMPQFAAQLETLVAAAGGHSDAVAALAFFQGANDIAQRGYGGDATAVADLAGYLGSDVETVVSHQITVGVTVAGLGC